MNNIDKERDEDYVKKLWRIGYSMVAIAETIKIPLKEVPVGYIYQVISWGYGGMASHEVQLPNPADRWRVIAYVRTLQYSQSTPEADLPANTKTELSNVGGSK